MNVQSLFDALSDSSRRNMVLLLMQQDEMCVCNIHAQLNMSQPKASRHLAVLRDCGLVLARREGKWMHYRLHPDIPLWCYRVLEGMRDGSLEPGAGVADQSPCDAA
jgi:ArsR family transcriptional regulator